MVTMHPALTLTTLLMLLPGLMTDKLKVCP